MWAPGKKLSGEPSRAQGWNQPGSQQQCGCQVKAASSQCPSLVTCKLHYSHISRPFSFSQRSIQFVSVTIVQRAHPPHPGAGGSASSS